MSFLSTNRAQHSPGVDVEKKAKKPFCRRWWHCLRKTTQRPTTSTVRPGYFCYELMSPAELNKLAHLGDSTEDKGLAGSQKKAKKPLWLPSCIDTDVVDCVIEPNPCCETVQVDCNLQIHELEESKRTLEESKGMLEQWVEELEESKGMLEQRVESKGTLEQRVEELEESKGMLEQRVEELEKSKGTLQQLVDELLACMHAANNQFDQERQERDQQAEEMHHVYSAQIKDQQRELEEARSSRDELFTQSKENEKKLESLEAEVMQLREAHASSERARWHAEQELADEISNSASVKSWMMLLLDEKRRRKARIAQLEEDNATVDALQEQVSLSECLRKANHGLFKMLEGEHRKYLELQAKYKDHHAQQKPGDETQWPNEKIVNSSFLTV